MQRPLTFLPDFVSLAPRVVVMKQLFQALKSAADGAFVVNKEQQIVYWNQAAQDILGHISIEVVGQPCYEVLVGSNGQDRLNCQEHCWVAGRALSGRPVTNHDVCVHTKTDGPRWVNMSTFSFPTHDDGLGVVLVHLFRDVTQKKQQELFIDQVLGAAKSLNIESSSPDISAMPEALHASRLTDRESEVLTLLAHGHSTNNIAHALSISPSTVRNHVRNILQKLQVHNRLEAVIYALKHGLIAK